MIYHVFRLIWLKLSQRVDTLRNGNILPFYKADVINKSDRPFGQNEFYINEQKQNNGNILPFYKADVINKSDRPFGQNEFYINEQKQNKNMTTKKK